MSFITTAIAVVACLVFALLGIIVGRLAARSSRAYGPRGARDRHDPRGPRDHFGTGTCNDPSHCDLLDRLQLQSEAAVVARTQAEHFAGYEARFAALQDQNVELREQIARVEAQRIAQQQQLAEERAFVVNAQKLLAETFEATSAKALRDNMTQFLDLARTSFERQRKDVDIAVEERAKAVDKLVAPIRDSLANVDQQFREIERRRSASDARLVEQIQRLDGAATTLSQALRAPKTRGRWGEMQLRRVVEMAGMVDHCDFFEQTSSNVDGGRLQPDLVVQMAGGRSIVVDAKTPMDAYLDALEAVDPATRKQKLKEHAARVRAHVRELSRKSYWQQLTNSPALVVLFLPGEDLYSAALEADPQLLEAAVPEGVIIATPTTLIATLLGVAQGWREEALAENARQISDLGRELYNRLTTMADKWSKVGSNLDRAARSYNEASASLESRVLVAARRFGDLDVATHKDLEPLSSVDTALRQLAAPELAQRSSEPETAAVRPGGRN